MEKKERLDNILYFNPSSTSNLLFSTVKNKTLKTMWESEEILFHSTFSFSCIVFNALALSLFPALFSTRLFFLFFFLPHSTLSFAEAYSSLDLFFFVC